MTLQKRTIQFDIIFNDEDSVDPIKWDFIELLDLWSETMRNLSVTKSDLTTEDRQAFEEEHKDF